MPDLSRYEVKPGEVWRKNESLIPFQVSDISRYEAKTETGQPCPDSDLSEAMRIHGQRRKQLEELPLPVLHYVQLIEDSPSVRSSLSGKNPLDDDD